MTKITEILIIGGLKQYKKYATHIKKENDLIGLHIKTVRKTNKDGSTWEKDYFYKKEKRSEQEISEMITNGKDKRSSEVRYKDKYLGKSEPEGFVKNEILELINKGLVRFEDEEMITDEKTYEFIKQIAGGYFNDLTIYILK